MKIFVNSLTLTRLFTTFLLPFLGTSLGKAPLLILLICILLTDFFDGFLARTFHVNTLFGKIMDTVADKVFGIMVLLLVTKSLPIYHLLIAFEVIIASINVTAFFFGATLKSSFLGRCKMWLLGASSVIGFMQIYELPLLKTINNILIKKFMLPISMVDASVFITLGAQIMIAIDYVFHIGKELKNKSEKIQLNWKDRKELQYVLFDTEYYLKNKDISLIKNFIK